MTHKHNDIQENIERQTDKVQHKTQDNTEQEIILKKSSEKRLAWSKFGIK